MHWRGATGVSLGLLGLFGTTAAAAQTQAVTAFVNVSVIPMDRERVLARQTVLVQGDRILAMGPVGQVRVPARATRIEGKGRYLLPGLADMHVHLLGNSEGTAFQFVAAGVTTVRDMLADEGSLALKGRITRGEIVGPHIYTARKVSHCALSQFTQCVAEVKAAGYDFIKFYESIDLDRTSSADSGSPAAGTPAYDRQGFDSLVAAARRVGIRISGHMQKVGIEWALRAQVASAEHAYGYIEYAETEGHTFDFFGSDTTPPLDGVKLAEIAAATRRAGTWVVPTLALHATMEERTIEQIRYRLDPKRARQSVLRSQLPVIRQYNRFNLQVVKALHDAGAGLLLGTDARLDVFFFDHSYLPGPAVLRELELLVAAGLTPYQALEISTRNAAVFLGTLNQSGTVAVGKHADLVLLTTNPLKNIRHMADVAGVMVRGQWLSRAALDTRRHAIVAETITPQDVARHLDGITDDARRSRDTLSRRLELAAQYVARQFGEAGLKPGGDNGTWLQRYPLGADTVTAPNIVGILEGSDPKLKKEYIVIAAHMDHVGIGASDRDSIATGADDNVLGRVGVIELAQAFGRQSEMAPRRSLIFLTVSGQEHGFSGSGYFVEHPPVPVQQIVATINLDMIGRRRADSGAVWGGESSSLGAVVAQVAAAHPELRLIVRLKGDDSRSDPVGFQKYGVPWISPFTGEHPDSRPKPDSLEKINMDAEARILRFAFYFAQEVANADQRPR